MPVLAIIWLLCAELCAWLAPAKKRRSWQWFVLGLIFGPFALSYLIFVKKKEHNVSG